jgi:hypothetical protein
MHEYVKCVSRQISLSRQTFDVRGVANPVNQDQHVNQPGIYSWRASQQFIHALVGLLINDHLYLSDVVYRLGV